MLEFCESWDHYSNAEMFLKWTSFNHGGIGAISAVGRFGTNGYAMTGARQITKFLGSKQERIYGFAASVSGYLNSNRIVIAFLDAGSLQVEIRIFDGVLQGTTNGVAIAGAVGTTFINEAQYNYIEVRVLHHASAGELEVRLNGNVEFALTGVDTQATANASHDTVMFCDPTGGGGDMLVDDIYVLDDVDSTIVGAPNNDFLGDIKVKALFPNANGTTSDLVGSDSDSTDNYLLVDETTPDDDTTYVESSAVGDKDTYNYEPLTNSGSVYGAQIAAYARKTDAGSRSIASVARLGATEENSADRALSADYVYYFDVREGNPDGDQWTIADVNAAEFGMEVTV